MSLELAAPGWKVRVLTIRPQVPPYATQWHFRLQPHLFTLGLATDQSIDLFLSKILLCYAKMGQTNSF